MGRDPTNSSDPAAMSSTRTVSPKARAPRIDDIVESGPEGLDQLLRPMLGLRPWFALERRALSFFFCVRFDIGVKLRAGRSRSLLDDRGMGAIENPELSRDFRASGGVTTCESQLGYPATRAAVRTFLAVRAGVSPWRPSTPAARRPTTC